MNVQWYERFNTRYKVAKLVGAEFNCFEVLWDYCANLISPGSSFNDLDFDDQKKSKEMAEERYLAYIFIQNSGSHHETLRRELQNDYTKGSDRYPDN